MSKIDEAKKLLRDNGYFVDNLWHIDDIKIRFDVTDNEDAQLILYYALTNEWIINQIHHVIGDAAEAEGFEELIKDEDDE